MRQIRQMLRLAQDGVSAREIGRTLGVARSTIQDNLKRAATAGLSWPLAGDLTDAVLEQRLFAHAGVKRGFRRRVEPDWATLACELKRPGVNLMVLWEEYRDAHPDGYGYSRFCDLYREFERRLSPTMRQGHPAGDKVFVDYSGKKLSIVDRTTGVVREAEIFIAVLGASNYTYAEATWTQTLPDWIEAHVRMFRFLGGVPRLIVPDRGALRRVSAHQRIGIIDDRQLARWSPLQVSGDTQAVIAAAARSRPLRLLPAHSNQTAAGRTPIRMFHDSLAYRNGFSGLRGYRQWGKAPAR